VSIWRGFPSSEGTSHLGMLLRSSNNIVMYRIVYCIKLVGVKKLVSFIDSLDDSKFLGCRSFIRIVLSSVFPSGEKVREG
jgi:hypothetical protein